MANSPAVVTNFKDIEADERVREVIEKRCEQLGQEFHELQRVEVTLEDPASRVPTGPQA